MKKLLILIVVTVCLASESVSADNGGFYAESMPAAESDRIFYQAPGYDPGVLVDQDGVIYYPSPAYGDDAVADESGNVYYLNQPSYTKDAFDEVYVPSTREDNEGWARYLARLAKNTVYYSTVPALYYGAYVPAYYGAKIAGAGAQVGYQGAMQLAGAGWGATKLGARAGKAVSYDLPLYAAQKGIGAAQVVAPVVGCTAKFVGYDAPLYGGKKVLGAVQAAAPVVGGAAKAVGYDLPRYVIPRAVGGVQVAYQELKPVGSAALAAGKFLGKTGYDIGSELVDASWESAKFGARVGKAVGYDLPRYVIPRAVGGTVKLVGYDLPAYVIPKADGAAQVVGQAGYDVVGELAEAGVESAKLAGRAGKLIGYDIPRYVIPRGIAAGQVAYAAGKQVAGLV